MQWQVLGCWPGYHDLSADILVDAFVYLSQHIFAHGPTGNPMWGWTIVYHAMTRWPGRWIQDVHIRCVYVLRSPGGMRTPQFINIYIGSNFKTNLISFLLGSNPFRAHTSKFNLIGDYWPWTGICILRANIHHNIGLKTEILGNNHWLMQVCPWPLFV